MPSINFLLQSASLYLQGDRIILLSFPGKYFYISTIFIAFNFYEASFTAASAAETASTV